MSISSQADTARGSKPRALGGWAVAAILVAVVGLAWRESRGPGANLPDGRREVVFWHFWGGKDRNVVEEIAARFNASQSEHFVRSIAMPGNNLDMKFFLSVAGNDPPDLVNQDDPVVADWAHRGAILPIDELATPEEYSRLKPWLFSAASAIGTYNGRLYALCNGLDIRALYYDRDVLDEFGLSPPRTLDELDRTALRIAPPELSVSLRRYGFLPDPRRIWAWGIVFGGRFYDPATGDVTADGEPIVRALDWMASYSRRYGAEQVARFRKGEQALPGASFPLLQGRYVLVTDGQWRAADIAAAEQDALRCQEPVRHFGAVPLPPPDGGLERAGWVNGNFFVVPRGCKNPQGAWAFMKFWSGFGGHESEAARACIAGGWIPASQKVVDEPTFQQYLAENQLFATFVDLAGSPNQVPTPAVPGAQFFYDEIVRAAEDAMYGGVPARDALQKAVGRVRQHLHEVERAR